METRKHELDFLFKETSGIRKRNEFEKYLQDYVKEMEKKYYTLEL